MGIFLRVCSDPVYIVILGPRGMLKFQVFWGMRDMPDPWGGGGGG